MRKYELLKFAAVVLTVVGVGLIAYAGLSGTDRAWGESGINANSVTMGMTGYVLGGVCVAAGIGILVLAERLK
jgi:hypothetical protein